MKLRKELFEEEMDDIIPTSPIMVVRHKGEVEGEIRMFMNYAEAPAELQANTNSEYRFEKFREIVEEEYDKTDYLELLYGVNMEIDKLGMYYIHGDVEDEEKVLEEECVKCGEEFEEGQKVYFDSEHSERFKEYCEDCKRQLEVADQL